jgi:hypothetical protein
MEVDPRIVKRYLSILSLFFSRTEKNNKNIMLHDIL